MQHPERLPELVAVWQRPRADMSTPAQLQAGERYLASLEPIDYGKLFADQPQLMP
jgi:hypothetical protein